jgi:hypothetical protein
MPMFSARPNRRRDPARASELVMRVAVVLCVASAITFAAVALAGLNGSWTLVALGEALLSLTLLSQI